MALTLEGMLQSAATLQTPSVWTNVVSSQPELSLRQMVAATHAAASPLHGTGLFASRDVAEGALLTLYPVHAMGDTSWSATVDDEDSRHFGEVRTRAYRVELAHAALPAQDLWIDANPERDHVPGWLGHLANDVAVCANGDEESILKYYEAAAAHANAILVPLADAAPLTTLVATRAIAADEEVTFTYGHDYWVTRGGAKLPAYTPAVLRAARVSWKAKQRAHTSRVADAYAHEAAFLEVVLEQLSAREG